MADADVSEILPTIRVPTLLLYRSKLSAELAQHPATRQGAENADRMASMIPNARAIGVPGRDISPFVGDEIPTEVERFLSDSPSALVPDTVLATVLFTDIVGSTERAAVVGDEAWRDQLAQHRQALRREIARYGGREIDTAGDGFLITFDGPARAIFAARAMIDAASQHGLTIRAGAHTGECQRDGNALAGIAVHIGARITALAQPDELLVSRTVTDLVAGSGIQFLARGDHQLKGVPGTWQLYAVADTAHSTGQ